MYDRIIASTVKAGKPDNGGRTFIEVFRTFGRRVFDFVTIS